MRWFVYVVFMLQVSRNWIFVTKTKPLQFLVFNALVQTPRRASKHSGDTHKLSVALLLRFVGDWAAAAPSNVHVYGDRALHQLVNF